MCKLSLSVGLHFYPLLLAELRERLLDAQGGEASSPVGIPAFSHDLCHHPQSLNTARQKHTVRLKETEK